MRLVELKQRTIRPDEGAEAPPTTDHGAPGVDMTWVAELTGTELTGTGTGGNAHVHCAHFPAGSTLPRHPTPVWQVFAVVAGEGTVAADDDVPHPVSAGTAAVWSPGEEHTSWATTDMTVVIVQSRSEPTLPSSTS